MARDRPIVAIDGPSGAGKSTVSKRVAKELGYTHINTGALYRAVALSAKLEGIDWNDEDGLADLIESANIELEPDGRVLLDERDVSAAIRAPDISQGASTVSALGQVRAGLLELQRRLGAAGGAVLEGRDIGTVVFPDAEVKIFLDATLEARARRRFEELHAKGESVTFDHILSEVRARDQRDSERELSPLKPAQNATLIDSTDLTIDAVVDQIVTLARESENHLR